ncbi:MAG: XRE family transcriptional regulator, partial [Lysinibacillus sp.]
KKAKEILQVSHYQHVLGTISTAAESLPLEVLNESHFDEVVHKMQEMIELFQVETLNANTALVFYLKAAMGYAGQNRVEKALEMVERYCHTCYRLEFPLRLQGDSYFYLLSDWIEDKIQTCGQAPRDDLSIKKDLVKTMANNPAFECLYEHPTYKSLMSNLKHHLQIKEEH